jgi:hypothetical protein
MTIERDFVFEMKRLKKVLLATMLSSTETPGVKSLSAIQPEK